VYGKTLRAGDIFYEILVTLLLSLHVREKPDAFRNSSASTYPASWRVLTPKRLMMPPSANTEQPTTTTMTAAAA